MILTADTHAVRASKKRYWLRRRAQVRLAMAYNKAVAESLAIALQAQKNEAPTGDEAPSAPQAPTIQ